MTWTLDVPLPPRDLSPNRRVHWAKKHRAVADYRELVGWQAVTGLPLDARLSPAKVRVSLVFGTKGARATAAYGPVDADNAVAAFKAGFDGLADAGVVANDRGVDLGPVLIDADNGPWVRVTIEE